MADDCYDDEVLLENSPLSQYLKETCPDQEFDTVPSARKSAQPAVERENYTISGIVHAAKELIWKFFQLLYPPVIEHVNTTFVPEYSTLALESRCLFESDKQIVCAYYPKTGSSKSHGISLASYNRIWLFGICSAFFLCNDLGAGVHHLPTSLASGLPYLPAVHFSFYPILQVACYLYTPFLIHLMWTVFTLKRRHKKGIRCMKQCLGLLDQHGVLLRKCIRYIQEVEVISRGFTMVTPYTPIIRLENSTSSTTRRQCAVLRQSCFIAAKSQFSLLRDATLTGMRKLPLLAEIDHVSNYLATVDLQSIAPWFKVSEDDELPDSVAEYTSHFSLSALKAMNSLFCEQRSEFIRRLVLSISPAALLPDQTIGKSVLESWTSIVCAVNESSEASLGKLQRSYDCHRQRPSHNREQLPSDTQSQAKDGGSSQHRVINAVRSLRLHLEATLNRAISVEDALEETDGPITKESKVRCLTSEMLDAVKRELTASQDCLQEASSSLEKISDKHQYTAHSQQDIKDDADGKQDANQDNRVPIPLLPIRDTEIEFDDQVFEAYTDNEPWERYDEDDWGEGISEQEKLKRRREAEETKRLLQELRSVLSVRKAEREHMKLNRARANDETKNPTAANEFIQNKVGNLDVENTGLECRTSGLPKEDCDYQKSVATIASDHAAGGDTHMPSIRSEEECKLVDQDAMEESETDSKLSHESKQTDTQSVDETANHQSSNDVDQQSDTCRVRDSTRLATAEDEDHQVRLRLPFNFLPSLAAEAAKKSRLQTEEMFIGSDEESEE